MNCSETGSTRYIGSACYKVRLDNGWLRMTREQIVIFAILGFALFMFAWGRYRHDVVAATTLMLTVIFGLVDPSSAFAGFGHPAVITVASVLIISHALKLSGVVDLIAAKLIPYTKNQTMHIIALTAVVTVASAFMNNVGALALMLPVALATAAEHNRSPALLLMPLAFGSILGGMTTMIGTPPNIIIAAYRAEIAEEPFHMFHFSPVGAPVALIGVLFVAFIGWRLIPKARLLRNAPAQLFEITDYLVELQVGDAAKVIGKTIMEIEPFSQEGIDVIGLAHGPNGRVGPVSRRHVLEPDDVLVLRADPIGLTPVIEELGLTLVSDQSAAFEHLTSGELNLAEGVIQSGAPIEGRSVSYFNRVSGYSARLIAMARQSGDPLRRRLRRQTFEAGDILLVEGESDTIDETLSRLGMIPLAARNLEVVKPEKLWISLIIFAAAIAIGVIGLLPLTVTFFIAVGLYIYLKILPVRSVYENVDWPVIVLLAAMIPVGAALETTGATDLVANSIVSITSGLPALLVLTLVLVVTMFLSDVINNAATALVMAPISVGIASQLGANPDAFLMAVAVGASCAFLTPIGHQSNTLVMGPGGYAFTDYWRMGLPLEIVITVVGVAMIQLVWPLGV